MTATSRAKLLYAERGDGLTPIRNANPASLLVSGPWATLKTLGLLLFGAFFIALSGSAFGAQEAFKTLVIVNKNEGVYRQVTDTMTASPKGKVSFFVLAQNQLDNHKQAINDYQQIITIGTKAADSVYALKPQVPVLSALITSSGFQRLAEKHFASTDKAHQQGISVIFLDQPLSRLFNIGQMLVPKPRSVGILASDYSVQQEIDKLTKAHAQQTQFRFVTVDQNSRPINEFGPVIKNADFAITLAGKKAISASAAKWILRIGSQTRTPIIAYSKKYSQAGALASVYTSLENVSNDVLDFIAKTHTENPNTQSNKIDSAKGIAIYPQRFSIDINPAVARALKIEVESNSYYHTKLLELEANQ